MVCGSSSSGVVPMGLLLPHKRTATVYPDMLSLSENVNRNGGNYGKRGKIEIFSQESRYRLFRLFHSLEFRRWTFCTLTYGETLPPDPRECKVHLKAYRRAFERRYGKVRGVWRMELQERGAAHFHILYLDPPFVPIAEWNRLWDDCSHRPIAERYGNSVDIEVGWRQADSDVVSKYLGKYIGKPDQRIDEDESISYGRWWGKWNIEEPKPVKIELYAVEALILTRLLFAARNPGEWMPDSTDNYTLFGKTMGKTDFQEMVLKEIARILAESEKIKSKKVTEVTCNS